QSLGPACLLGFEGRHLDREFGGAFDVLQVDEFPSFPLCAIREISVLGERLDRSVSSVSVSCCQPPASSIVVRRHRPAVPLKLKNSPVRARPECSSTKCPSSRIASTSVKNE